MFNFIWTMLIEKWKMFFGMAIWQGSEEIWWYVVGVEKS